MSIKILFHSGIVTLTSPSKVLTGTIFLHAHLQAVYYNCVKFHLNPMSRLGGVALTSPSLHTEHISEYKLNYLPFQILDSNHIPSCTSAGSVLQLCKGNRIGFKQSHFVEDLVATSRCMFLVSLF
jgi:hypothetical protein